MMLLQNAVLHYIMIICIAGALEEVRVFEEDRPKLCRYHDRLGRRIKGTRLPCQEAQLVGHVAHREERLQQQELPGLLNVMHITNNMLSIP